MLIMELDFEQIANVGNPIFFSIYDVLHLMSLSNKGRNITRIGKTVAHFRAFFKVIYEISLLVVVWKIKSLRNQCIQVFLFTKIIYLETHC